MDEGSVWLSNLLPFSASERMRILHGKYSPRWRAEGRWFFLGAKLDWKTAKETGYMGSSSSCSRSTWHNRNTVKKRDFPSLPPRLQTIGLESIDTVRLFGSGPEDDAYSTTATKGSVTDLSASLWATAGAVCETETFNYDQSRQNVTGRSPEEEDEDRLIDGCSLDGDQPPEVNRHFVRVASNQRHVSVPLTYEGQFRSRRRRPRLPCDSRPANPAPVLHCEHQQPAINANGNEPNERHFGIVADGDVRPIMAECGLCQSPRRAAKRCFYCAYICRDCFPCHERYYPLHITIPPAFEFSAGYFCNAVARRALAGLVWFLTTLVFVLGLRDI